MLRSVLRDKSVVQGAIKTLQEEVGALKSTNMELQNQLCLVSASACSVAAIPNALQATGIPYTYSLSVGPTIFSVNL